MTRTPRSWIGVMLLVPALALANDPPAMRSASDRQIIDQLGSIHDRGATLFNGGDPAGCYRLFQGALLTVRLMLPKELQETVDRGLSRADQLPVPAQRAMILHEVIEDVRKKLHPTAGKGEKLPPPRTTTGTDGSKPMVPGVPQPPDSGKSETPKVVDVPRPMEPTGTDLPKLDPPKPPPNKLVIDPPPAVITGVPTVGPGVRPSRPTQPNDPTVPDMLSVPPRPVDPPPMKSTDPKPMSPPPALDPIPSITLPPTDPKPSVPPPKDPKPSISAPPLEPLPMTPKPKEPKPIELKPTNPKPMDPSPVITAPPLPSGSSGNAPPSPAPPSPDLEPPK